MKNKPIKTKKIAENTIKPKVEKIKNANVRLNCIKEFDICYIHIFIDQIIEPAMRPRTGGFNNIYDPLKRYKKILREKIENEINTEIPKGEDYYLNTEVIVSKKPLKSFSIKRKVKALLNEYKWNTKPDVDNILKTIYDSVEGIFFINDSQIVRETTEKRYGEKESTEIIFKIYKQPDTSGRMNKNDIPNNLIDYFKKEDE